jgi:uncharacterized protein
MLDLELDIDEFDELTRKLVDVTEGRAMHMVTVEGFFAALIVGPALVAPSEWLPRVWDREGGTTAPEVSNPAELRDITDLVMRFYNTMATRLADRVIEDYEPLFPPGSLEGTALWCAGFLRGMEFDPEEWKRRIRAEPGWFAPILLPLVRLENAEDLTAEDVDYFDEELPYSLAQIREYWRRHPRPPIGGILAPLPFDSDFPHPRRTGSRIGRNELCRCGSGKKYKKCCGAANP